MEIVKYDIFQGASGRWYINCPKRVSKIENLWWYPARRMNMNLDKYVEMLVKDFHVDYIHFDNILYFAWSEKNYSYANKFKLFLNKKAREGKWMC